MKQNEKYWDLKSAHTHHVSFGDLLIMIETEEMNEWKDPQRNEKKHTHSEWNVWTCLCIYFTTIWM